MRTVAADVVEEINRLIERNASVIQGHGNRSGTAAKNTRTLHLDLNNAECPIKQHKNLGLADLPASEPVSYTDFWVHQIIAALVTKRHLFSQLDANIHYYKIQA